MTKALAVLAIVAASIAAGCGTTGQKFDGWKGVQAGERITVLPLSDHPSDDPKDRDGTGLKSQNAIVTAMKKELAQVDIDAPVPANYDAKRGYDRDAALAVGRERSSTYVLYGKCTDFYNVAPFTFRADRGGIEVELVAVADGRLVYRLTKVSSVNNLSNPESAIEGIADTMADELKPGD
jgi:hypothetical protein